MTAQQLKNSILQMAVQGKLVPQDPNDEPASVLLERIKAEKEELIKSGKIKKSKKSSEIFRGASRNLPYAYCEQIGKEIRDISDEIPFDIPDSWEWARLLSVSYHVGDKSNQILAKEVVPEGIVPVVSQGKVLIDGYSNHLEKAIDLLPLVMFGDHTRNVKYIDFKFVIGADGTKFHKVIIADSKYVYYWMQYVVVNLRDRGYARHYSLLTEQFLPLPPLSEQHRIVSKIEELLPYIEAYEKAETQLTTLNTTFPEMLKKSILQEAIQGKLVPQNPDDEPASVLLKRIRAEKQSLIKQGKIKKSKHESVIITRDKIPYEIPDSWAWCRLSDICQSINDGDHQPPPQEENGKPFIVISNISGDRIDFSNTRYVPEEYYSRLNDNRKPMKNDILFTVTGSYGIVIKVDTDREFCFQRHIALLKPLCVDRDILVHWLTSPLVFEQCKKTATGTAQKTVGITSLKNIIIPLPPLPEQKRIVEKIEELIPMINSMSK